MSDNDLAVKIVPYNRKAIRIFAEVKQFLHSLIPYQVGIEHIGSTAVPGLGGKGIVDVLIITGQEYMQNIVKLLESRGYRYNPQASTPPEKLFLSGPYEYLGRELHIHIHITFFGSRERQDKLLFRDYLREHPKEAKRYYELKKQWATKAGSDASRYTELKAPYVKQVLDEARKGEGGSIV